MNLKYDEIKEIEFEGVKVKVKQYLPFAEKQIFVQNVVDSYFSDIKIPEDFKKDFAIFKNYIQLYTDLEIPTENNAEFYDMVVGSNLYDYILSTIPDKEKLYLETKITDIIFDYEEKIEKIYQRENCLENIVNDFLNNLLVEVGKLNKKIPSSTKLKNMLEKSIPKMVNSVDKKKLTFINDALKMNNGINKGKK